MSGNTSRAPLRINRQFLGLLALACVVTAIVRLSMYDVYDRWGGSFANVGALLWATWLVVPKDGRLPQWLIPTPWTAAGILLLLFLFIRRPRMMLPVVAALIVGAVFLRPRKRT